MSYAILIGTKVIAKIYRYSVVLDWDTYQRGINMARKPKADAVIQAVKGRKSDRERITLYLSRELYERLQKICEKQDVAASGVVEKLIQDFVESTEK
jgi:GTP cyclohydrolase FolE2